MTGAPSEDRRQHTVVASPTSFALSGAAATVHSRREAAAGALAITGAPATLERPGRQINAEPATFSVSGEASATQARRALQLAPAAFTLTGAPSTSRRTVGLPTGALAVLGSTSNRRLTSSLAAGSATVTGAPVTFTCRRSMVLEDESLIYIGSSATLIRAFRNVFAMTAAPGAFQLRGAPARMRRRHRPADLSTYVGTSFVGYIAPDGRCVPALVQAAEGYLLSLFVFDPVSGNYHADRVPFDDLHSRGTWDHLDEMDRCAMYANDGGNDCLDQLPTRWMARGSSYSILGTGQSGWWVLTAL
jgi:hypothetical protein